ncbi:hypothetical protein HPP92_014623 [Vanilla planifolia]|uniref:Uncharacterized protein n=1 Tax=Vanilla planifolia TaxID=51239 RepID=A0A835UV12_VANPL|nr:hypothetical protein HPP92_014623 [Vanilla planifolia]
MNDLSGAGNSGRRVCGSVPASLASVLAAVLFLGITYSLFILVVVHNALLLAAIMLLSALVVSFVLWNLLSYKKNLAILCFVDRLPTSDLLSASDGQLVKITGLASCGDFALESSYEKVQRCVYTSTLLYENRSFWCKILSAKNHHSVPMATSSDERYYCWKLTYLEVYRGRGFFDCCGNAQ